MKISPKLSTIQREILIGCILGDCHLRTQTNGTTYSCYFEQSDNNKHSSHREYLFHLYDCFKNLCTPEMIPKRRLNVQNLVFQTRALRTFSFYGNLFYTVSPQTGKRTKVLPTRPNLLKKLITPISLAYWYMDDGGMKSKQSKGVLLNTHNFTLKEVQLLCQILNTKFDLLAKPRLQKHLYKGEIRCYYQIYISGHSFEILGNLIYEHIHPSMLYKWPSVRKRKVNYRMNTNQFYNNHG
jgi:hypothetical protein